MSRLVALREIRGQEVAHLQSRLRRGLAGFANEGYAIVKRDEWVAVPDDSGGHIGPDSHRFLRALRDHGDATFFAIPVDLDINPPVPAYEVPANALCISEIDRITSPFSYAFFSGKPDWYVLSTVNDFIVICGPPDFVQTYTGRTIDKVFADFHSLALHYGQKGKYGEAIKRRLLFVYRQLKEVYPLASDGDVIQLDP